LSLPHVNQVDRDALEDRGLVDDDNTEIRTALAAMAWEAETT
jgi:hypothetical protein